MKKAALFLLTVVLLSVALPSVSPGRGDAGPPSIVQVVNQQPTDVVNVASIETVAVPADVGITVTKISKGFITKDHVLLIKQEAIKQHKSGKFTDPFYHERRQADQIRYMMVQYELMIRNMVYQQLRC